MLSVPSMGRLVAGSTSQAVATAIIPGRQPVASAVTYRDRSCFLTAAGRGQGAAGGGVWVETRVGWVSEVGCCDIQGEVHSSIFDGCVGGWVGKGGEGRGNGGR